MAFKKGQSGNPDGRRKGAANRTTAEAREVFNSILNNELDNITEALAQVRSKDNFKYLDVLSKLLAYYLPKAQIIDLTANLDSLSEEQLIILGNHFFKQTNDANR